VRIAALGEVRAEAGLSGARAAWDPVLTASGSAATSESAGFLAGFPTSSTSEDLGASAGIRVTAPTGTTVTLGASADRSASTSIASLGGVPTEQEVSTWSGGVDVTVTQDLLAPLRASSQAVAARAAREQLTSATIARRQADQDGISAVAEAWWAWWSATDAAHVAARGVELAAALEERTRALLAEGQIARLELDRVTADRLDAQRTALQAAAEVRRAADELLVTIGEPPGQELVPAGPGTLALPLELDRARAIAQAEAANLELAAARAELAAAEAALGDARDAGLPTLELTASIGRGSLSETAADAVDDLLGDDGLPRASAAVDLALPLGGRAARAERRDARAALEIERIQLANLEGQVEARVRAAVDAVEVAREGLALSEARVEVAWSTEEGEQARVDEGLRRLDQLLEARAAREQAQADLRAATIELGRAELGLATLLGHGG
jgi:outer membrane protein